MPPPEVLAPTERRVPGLRVRRARRAPIEATLWRGIPITNVPRTLVDLAAVLREGALPAHAMRPLSSTRRLRARSKPCLPAARP